MGGYRSIGSRIEVDRRGFLRGLATCSMVAGGAVLGVPPVWAAGDAAVQGEVETNLDQFMKVPRAAGAIPGPFPGRVVQVQDPKAVQDDRIDAAVVREMFTQGLTRLTGRGPKESFNLLIGAEEVVGLKVNPVGPPLINTRHELVEAVIRWLVDSGLPKGNIVIWDRFDTMLTDAGFTAARYPGVRIEALQTMDEKGTGWRRPDGHHVSEDRFDRDAFYFAKGIVGKGVPGYQDDEFYLNQHVFNGEYSYFGKLVSSDLTKIINLPVFKNTGNGISMATKNLGFAAVCNTGRLHVPLFFRVCTEVLAAPWVRDKLALNVTDGLRGQYEGGPEMNAQFIYPHASLYFATDPFALDSLCHRQMVAKRKEMGIQVNEHPRYTEYLRQGERLGLGVAAADRIEHVLERRA
jgi:hypothetical protein